ncbi:MAG: hypothetical protein KI790_14665 [Cyclobacteriaceae bacterium]|nr:hypothetical protein [Cyclobacteriaceae bacterium HetDA_MAG_MS6]
MLNIFGKKKKEFKAQCHISKEPVQKESSYFITTAELISSKKFWDNVMTEPETMSYTVSHFKNGDKTATHMRSMIFNKYSSEDKPWIISESYIHLFEVDKSKSRETAEKWWDLKGQFEPEESKSSLQNLGDKAFEEIKSYAVMDAGRSRVA